MAETRIFGRSGLTVSALGFGCGAVGGLMVRGEPADQERAVAYALDHGVTFFDTAPAYGEGRSETNLGRALAKLRPEITLATKFSIKPEDRGRIPAAIRESLGASLKRLGRDSVDVYQLHDAVGGSDYRPFDPETVLGEIVPTLERLREDGLIRVTGMTGVGDTSALHQVVDSGAIDSLQAPYNLLNPTMAKVMPEGTGPIGQDFRQLMQRATTVGMGSIGIRVLAGGALSGSMDRHPVAMTDVAPIGTGQDYSSDVEAAQRFRPLIEAAGATSLVEVALRFAIGAGGPSTVLIGVATVEQFADAVAAVEKGPLPKGALDLLPGIWAQA